MKTKATKGPPMHYFESTATIDASPETVWGILTSASAYPTWDSGVDSVEGRIADGETITVHSKANPGRAFPVKVGNFEPNCCMSWTGGMPMGLFTGVRTFRLTSTEGGPTELHVREEYHGPLVPIIWRSMPDLQPSFDQFAQGLRMAAEQMEAEEEAGAGGRARVPSRPPT